MDNDSFFFGFIIGVVSAFVASLIVISCNSDPKYYSYEVPGWGVRECTSIETNGKLVDLSGCKGRPSKFNNMEGVKEVPLKKNKKVKEY